MGSAQETRRIADVREGIDMKTLHLIPAGTNIPFITARKATFALSLLLILASLGLFFTQGLNLGIDFKGGTLIEIKTDGPADLTALRRTLTALDLGEVSIQEFGAADTVLIRVQAQEDGEDVSRLVKPAIDDQVAEYRRTEVVGPTVGAELKIAGITAVLISLGALMVYIWFRFEWQFALGAVVALAHDIITTIGLFALTGLEFNLATVAAVLTIAGYSINDTVVVFDRVRENLRRYRKADIADVLNRSINETLARTVMTSVTTLLALLALVILGGEVIRGFALALIWGVLIGTYSSICVAVPLLLKLDLRRDAPDQEEARG